MVEISEEEPKVRRFGEEGEDVAIIIDGGADVALFPEYGRSRGRELEFNSATTLKDAQGNRPPTAGATSVEISLRDTDGHEALLKEKT